MAKSDILKKINKRKSKLPRLLVKISNKNYYAQIVDDNKGKIIAAASTLKIGKEVKDKDREVGRKVAKAAKILDVEKVVFDTCGRRYHGHVKNIADAARKAGLKF